MRSRVVLPTTDSSTPTGPSSSQRKRPKAPAPASNTFFRSCNISALFFLLLGFQGAWIFAGLSQRGGWAELKEVERRLTDRLELISQGQDERIRLLADQWGKSGAERPVKSELVENVEEWAPREAGPKSKGVLELIGPTREVGVGAGLRAGLRLEEAVPLSNLDAADEYPDRASIGEGVCNSQNRSRKAGTIQWKPKAKRYLLAMCSGGQLSNRLACIRQNMLDAAIMNRTLILPTAGIDYNYHNLLDLGAMERCFGEKLVLALEEYAGLVDNRVRVGRFICHIHTYQTEDVCHHLVRRYTRSLNITFAKVDIARRRTPGPWFKYPATDFVKKFGSDHHVVAFGNMFGVGGRELRFEGAAPLVVKAGCRGFLQPSKAVQEVASGFINSFLGANFMAVHLRRGDFFQHCLKGPGKSRKSPCFHPIQQIATCLVQRLKEHPHVHTIFLATNAEEMELEVLKSVLQYEGKNIPIVCLPKMGQQSWAQPLSRSRLAGNADVISLVDKSICSKAAVFFGTWGSTFTHDIFRLRDWWHLGSNCEAYICGTEEAADVIDIQEDVESGNATSTT